MSANKNMSLAQYKPEILQLVPGPSENPRPKSVEYWKRKCEDLEKQLEEQFQSTDFWRRNFVKELEKNGDAQTEFENELEKAKNQEANQTRASQMKSSEIKQLAKLNRKLGKTLK